MNNCGDSLMVEQDLFQSLDGGSIPTSPLQLFFRKIQQANANRVFTKFHYAHRAVPISECFGAYKVDKMQTLVGAISFGKPASNSLCEGCCGKENAYRIFELNRLWMSNECPKNSESRFIGWSLRILKQLHPDWILVSYADTEQNHSGAIYRATGWIYTGLSAERMEWRERGTNKHSKSVTENRKWEDYSTDPNMEFVERSRKHRYFYFFNKKDVELLKYPIIKFDNTITTNQHYLREG